MSEVFKFTILDDPTEYYIEAWTHPNGQRELLKGGLNYWLMSDGLIDVGTVGVELGFQRQGVASRLFAQLGLRHPEISRYKATVATFEGEALFRSLIRRHPNLDFDLRREDGSSVL